MPEVYIPFRRMMRSNRFHQAFIRMVKSIIQMIVIAMKRTKYRMRTTLVTMR